MSATAPDLSTLPAPAVVEALDFERINAAHRADLLARHPEAGQVLALESEPLTKLIEAHAYRELLFRQRVNEAARAHLLAFAVGGDLDHKGAFYGLPRLPGEDDAHYRRRIQLRIAALAGNGTREHYELIALTTSAAVRDAYARQPEPGRVQVLLWIHDGADAEAVRATVEAALNAESARPLGVPVSAAIARARAIDVRARLTRERGAPADLVAQIATGLPTAIENGARLGQNLARSWITTLLHVPGIAAVRYLAADAPPELTVLAGDEYARAGVVQLIDEGTA